MERTGKIEQAENTALAWNGMIRAEMADNKVGND